MIGDSHSQEFSRIKGCTINYLGPKTMHRIGRDGLDVLNFQTLGISDGDTVILAFGEIDVRCHIGKQRDIFKRDLNEVISTLLDNYFNTILLNQLLYTHLNIAVYTITPPVFSASNIGYESYGSASDRVFITKLLNQELIQQAKNHGLGYLDVYDDYADEEGLLISEYSDGSVHINPIHDQAIRLKLDKLK